jgi:hypothetical protein
MVRQLRTGRRGWEIEVDPVSAVQVAARRHLTTPEVLRRFERAAPRASLSRGLWARLAGPMPMRIGDPVHETWTIRYLMEVIYTRDTGARTR